MGSSREDSGWPHRARSLTREWTLNLVLSIAAVAVFLVLLEITLRIHQWGRHPRPAHDGRDNEWVFFDYDPLLGWRNKPGAEGTFVIPDSRSHVSVNRQGLRDVEHSYAKDRRFRILVLGDSFTWGFGVEQGERFPDRLQAKLGSAVEVIDAGVSGWGTDQELLFLQSEGIRYAPDLVILALGLEDLLNNTSAVQYSYPKPYFVLEGGKLTLRNVPVPHRARSWAERWELEQEEGVGGSIAVTLARSARWLSDRSRSLEFLEWRAERAMERIRGEATSMDPVTGALLLALRDSVESHGGQLLVVLIPFRSAVAVHHAHARWSALTGFMREHGLAFLDLFPVFDSVPTAARDFYFQIDSHWNAAGHERAERALEEYITSQRLVSGLVRGASHSTAGGAAPHHAPM